MTTSCAFRESTERQGAHDHSVGNWTNESDEDMDSSTDTWVRTLNNRIVSEDSDEPQTKAAWDARLTARNHAAQGPGEAAQGPGAHNEGRCRPCVFFSIGGCRASDGCRYCHEFHRKVVPEKRLLRRVRKITRDMIKGNIARIFGQDAELDNLRDELQSQAERHHLAWLLIQNHLREHLQTAEHVD